MYDATFLQTSFSQEPLAIFPTQCKFMNKVDRAQEGSGAMTTNWENGRVLLLFPCHYQ